MNPDHIMAPQSARPHEPDNRSTPQQTTIVWVSGIETAGRFSMLETIEVQGAEPMCHRHLWEDEALYVLQGEVAVFRDGTWTRLAAGTGTFLPRTSEHSFAVLSTSARVLFVYAPGGFESWYREAAPRNPWSGDVEHVVATAAHYGCEITGPHPGTPNLG